jgi:hypothetical protein
MSMQLRVLDLAEHCTSPTGVSFRASGGTKLTELDIHQSAAVLAKLPPWYSLELNHGAKIE